MINPKRGEIYVINWNPGRGNEQIGIRPGLVISRNAMNQNPNYGAVIVLSLTTREKNVPSHVQITPSKETGLDHESWVMCEQVMTISKTRLQKLLGRASPAHIASVESTLKKTLNLE